MMIKNRISIFLATFLIVGLFFLALPEKGWAQPQEVTFNFTGGQQSFVVPSGVNSVHIQAWGAQGANSTLETTGLGGEGGFAEGDLAVTPGQTLEIFVGGQGMTIFNTTGGGGFNGGGDGRSTGSERAGGGGASDVRAGGATLNDRMIVAAGGGGANPRDDFFGGNGGGLVGDTGGGIEAGGGGTQNSGGAGLNNPSCLDGEFGLGGDSGSAFCSGGGGGWFGGGAGGSAGGGSSYIDGVTNGSTTSGGREGDGMIVLTFTPVVANVPTLSEWGLITMAGILGIIGFMVMRRRVTA